MKVRDIMTANPASCTSETDLREAARMMAENDCGALPVVDRSDSSRPLGIITDRDIVTRIVARGRNPLELRVADAMTEAVISVQSEESLEACRHLMEEHQLRRILVVDDGHCVGIVAQADFALNQPREETGEVVAEISRRDGLSPQVRQI